jgi:GntR family transcriptional regulator, gluconate operon transcriptional repressor
MKQPERSISARDVSDARLAHRGLARAVGTPGQHSTKLARSVYSGWVVAALREAIIEGELADGTPLVEARLAEQLSVSRGPVRSALHALEGEGLVRTRPNGRSVVVGFRSEDLADLLAVRFELESTAIAWGDKQRRDPWRIVEAFDALEAEGASTPALVDLDLEFHRALVEFSGSRFLLQAWLAIAPVIHSVITVGNKRLASREPESNFERIVANHKPIVQAVLSHHPVKASKLLAEQFGVTESMYSSSEGAGTQQ